MILRIVTIADILAMPELRELRARYQWCYRRAAVEWATTDYWFHATYGPGGDPSYPAGAEATALEATYRNRVNELCRLNGLPEYIQLVDMRQPEEKQ